MNIQSDIENILSSHTNQEKKISLLHMFFSQKKHIAFADFDDTVSTNTCLFYTKIKFLLRYKTSDEQKVFDYVIKCFSLNKHFIPLVHSKGICHIVILSRNHHRFLQYFIKWFETFYPTMSFTFVGAIGSTKDFILSTSDKIDIVPSVNFLLSDMFEYKQLKDLPNFLSIDTYTPIKYYLTLSKKLIRFLFFVLSVVGKKF